MKKTLTFHIEEKAETLQEGTFKVPSGCLTLTFVHDLDEAFAFLVFLLIRDPAGKSPAAEAAGPWGACDFPGSEWHGYDDRRRSGSYS